MRPDLEIGTGIPSDRLSEYSDGTLSQDSRDEIRDLGAGVYEERFRVDRRKLEQMLLVEDDVSTAETFFRKIMDETNTVVTWPSRLKIGAKSKKDPHIRVAGRPEDVRISRERILTELDTRQNNRVTLKMDVSYTDHSHIIGRGGLTIKSVMEDTGCHIHFPDSNRSNPMEKSNQVSIAGELPGVERARARVRELMPVVFCFEVPITGSLQPLPEPTCPFIQHVQERFSVQVQYRQRPKLHATAVVVKGCEWEITKAKEATLVLINYLCESLAPTITVEMSIEISAQHHSIVLGRGSQNLKIIMQRTGTRILFPDANDPNIPALKKSNITISGNIHSVYLARQHLLGSLPLVLLFEVREELEIDADHLTNLMESLDVFISVRRKPKQGTVAVVVKGIERNGTNVYEARRLLLGLGEPTIVADIPPGYHVPNIAPLCSLGALNIGFPGFLALNTGSPLFPSPVQSPSLSSPSSPPIWSPFATSATPSLPPPFGGLIAPLPQTFHKPSFFGEQHYETPAFSAGSSSTSSLSSPSASPRNESPIQHTSLTDLSSVLTELPDRRAPGCEKKTLERAVQVLDYERKRQMAVKAIQRKPVSGVPRVPTSSWSGCGFSRSMPDVLKDSGVRGGGISSLLTLKEEEGACGSDPWRTGSLLSASNYLDSGALPCSTTSDISDLPTLLAKLGLDKYSHVFSSQEIDLHMFLSLTDSDLRELGITTFGARRKMLLAIADLKKGKSFILGRVKVENSCSTKSPKPPTTW